MQVRVHCLQAYGFSVLSQEEPASQGWPLMSAAEESEMPPHIVARLM